MVALLLVGCGNTAGEPTASFVPTDLASNDRDAPEQAPSQDETKAPEETPSVVVVPPGPTGTTGSSGPRLPAAPTADVRYGERGENVGRLQLWLKLQTSERIDEDGKFGPRTKALLATYQTSAGLPVKDSADAALRSQLAADVAVTAATMQRYGTNVALGVPPLNLLAQNIDTLQVVPGEGDKTAYYAAGDRTGFAYGDGAESTGITQGSPAHMEWIAGDVLSPSEIRVIGTISHNEGPFDAVNSYDAGYYTWGAYQLIGAYRTYTYKPSSDELAQGLAVQKELDPVSFAECFQAYGFDVTYALKSDGTLDQASVDMTLTRPSGTVLHGEAVWMATGTETKLNQIFINAGRDLRIQRTHLLSAKAIHFDAIALPLQSGLPTVGEYFTSERLLAGFLDMELNRGRTGARTTFWASVQAVIATRAGLDPKKPSTWPASDRKQIELDIFTEALARAPTQRYRERLGRVGTSVFVSDEPASFVGTP